MMKKVLFGMMGAIALSFTACTSEDALVEVNPTYDAERAEVTTTFALNIGTAGSTRMSAANTQANVDQSFRGLQDAKLLAFKQTDNGKILQAAANAEKIFDLGLLLSKDQIAMNGSTSHRVLELALPMQTNTMLFYGRALKDGNAENQGVINGQPGQPTTGTFQAVQNLSDISFAATKRFSEEHMEEFIATENMIAAIINELLTIHVENMKFWWPEAYVTEGNTTTVYPMADATTPFTVAQINTISGWTSAADVTDIIADPCTVTFVDGNVVLKDALGNTYTYYNDVDMRWKTYGDQYRLNMDNNTSNDVTLTALEEILGNAYFQVVSIEEGAVRAGSGPAVARVSTDLFRSLTKVANAIPTTYEEKVAQLVAQEAVVEFPLYFDFPTETTDQQGNPIYGTWKSVANVVATVNGHNLMNPAVSADDLTEDLNEFPTNLTLPAGTAQLVATLGADADVFAYAGANITMHMGEGTINVNNIVYPAELMYFGNSPLKVSEVPKVEADYPEGLANWNNDSYEKWADFTGNVVKSTTRAVALAHEVNYGSALLETNVKLGAAQLKDNRGSVHNGIFAAEGDEEAARDLQLIGVLVGSQPNNVGWNFLAPADDAFNHVVYDHQIGDNGTEGIQINSTSVTATNYTLLFDNYVTGGDQKDVYVCLEFINNGKEFWGDHNLIRKGGTFYLVGKLEVSKLAGDNKITFSDDHRSTPPYANGKSDQTAQRIFIQDYKTIANFTIKDLKNAFVTVPDLRSSEISLGLSVDLKWESGFTFDIDIEKAETTTTGGN